MGTLLLTSHLSYVYLDALIYPCTPVYTHAAMCSYLHLCAHTTHMNATPVATPRSPGISLKHPAYPSPSFSAAQTQLTSKTEHSASRVGLSGRCTCLGILWCRLRARLGDSMRSARVACTANVDTHVRACMHAYDMYSCFSRSQGCLFPPVKRHAHTRASAIRNY